MARAEIYRPFPSSHTYPPNMRTNPRYRLPDSPADDVTLSLTRFRLSLAAKSTATDSRRAGPIIVRTGVAAPYYTRNDAGISPMGVVTPSLRAENLDVNWRDLHGYPGARMVFGGPECLAPSLTSSAVEYKSREAPASHRPTLFTQRSVNN